MPRQPRLNLPGLYYHVIVRGIERRRIFRAPGDYADFLARLGNSLAVSGCRCFAWALMPNHIHLLILSGVRGLVSLMHPLLTGYAVAFNLKYRRVGHLFQNRYKSIICQEDPYFLELLRYIALNPVRDSLVKTVKELAEYPWTSHSAILGNVSRPWQEVDAVLGRFGSTSQGAKIAYERFVCDGRNLGHQDRLEGGGLVRSQGGWENILKSQRVSEREASDVRILGDGDFVEDILRQAEKDEQRNLAVRKAWSKETLQRILAARVGLDADALQSTDRCRPVSEARSMLVYSAVDWLGMTGSSVGQWLGLSDAGVSQARRRGRRLAQERKLLEWLESEKLNNVP